MNPTICPVCSKGLTGTPNEVGNHILNCAKEQEKAAAEAKKKATQLELTAEREKLNVLQNQLLDAISAFMKKYPQESIEFTLTPGWTVYTGGDFDILGLANKLRKVIGTY